jgi:hypothetical protein
MKRSILLLISTVAVAILSGNLMAQEALKPRPSPMYMTTMKHNDTYVKITYGRPHKNNREIFGNLVPFGEVWRTGANEATELTTTGDIMLAGKRVKQGTYSLYTIPQQDKWTIILNSALGQWGAYEYDKQKDVMRFDVPVEKMDKTYEPFTIEFNQDNSDAYLLIMWDRTKVSIPLSFP